MNEQTSKRMKEMVSNIRSRAKRAEREFDRTADEIQSMASRSIDLFGGSATSQVADIAVKSKMACDRLYVEYQALITLLDEECRPLLSQDPSLEAVKEVRDLIVWLNEESKIENNFTASLNSHSLGDVASRRYLPSMSALAVQSFWTSKYDMFPGRREEEQRMRERERMNREQAAQKKEEAQARYEQDLAVWRSEAGEINARRSQLLEVQFELSKAAMTKQIEEKYRSALADARERAQKLNGQREAAERHLEQLGFFAFGEKKQCKQTIDECVRKLLKINYEVECIKNTYEQEKGDLPNQLKKCKEELEKKINAENPLPRKPHLPMVFTPGMSAAQYVNDYHKNAIYETLQDQGAMTVSQIVENCPACADLTNARVSALLRQMVTEDQVERFEENRRVYFRAC